MPKPIQITVNEDGPLKVSCEQAVRVSYKGAPVAHAAGHAELDGDDSAAQTLAEQVMRCPSGALRYTAGQPTDRATCVAAA